MLTVHLPESTARRLADAAARCGFSTSTYVENIITEHLDDMDDIREAEAVLDRVRRGEERVFTSAEVRHSLALDD